MEDEALKRPIKNEQEYLRKGREEIKKKYALGVRPVDKRENYIKRCVGIAGDMLEIIDGQVYINNKLLDIPENLQYKYEVNLKEDLSSRYLYKLGVTMEDQRNDFQHSGNIRSLVLSEKQVNELRNNPSVISINRVINPKGVKENFGIFPHDSRLSWSLDNFGPLWIPKKGESIVLTDENYAMYERAISLYEGNTLERKGDKFIINGVETNSYTFKMDYFWLMGDNRHSSLDSRFWGFVPEDHLVGKAVFVWFSQEQGPGKGFFESIRWNRVFTIINGK
jgi:signal peptidase I